MSSLANLAINLTANIAGFESDMGRAARASDKRAKEIQQQWRDVGKVVGGALAAGFAGLVAGTAKAIKSMDDVADAAKRVGVSAQSFSELKYAAEQSGAGV